VDAITERPMDLEEVLQPSAPVTFAQVYADCYLPMVRLGHLLTGSNEVGEEVTQEAFVRMYRRFDDVDNPGAYLRTSVVNGCRSWQRRQRLERRWLHRDVPSTVAGGPTQGELADVLADLPFRQRAALVLRFYEDRSIEEIATALDCRPGTAKSHVSRGLERMRKVIER
jgi:DNA-directed RNA polymerase specialized sigma24 family protein